MGNPKSPSSTDKKLVVDVFEQECLAQCIIDNRNAKMHSPDVEDEDIANDSKGNTEVYPGARGITELYPSNIHKVLTPINECKPIKLGHPVCAVQSMAFVTGGKGGGGKKGTKKYLPQNEWKALSADTKSKIIES